MDEVTQRLKRNYLASGDPSIGLRLLNTMLRAQGDELPSRATTMMTIPTIGTELELAADWTFPLYNESRCSKLWENYFEERMPHPPWGREARGYVFSPQEVTLPAGTILKVSRIYIRQNIDTFDSVTFTIKKCPKKNSAGKMIKGRFWAKLEHVNTMVVSWDRDTLKIDEESLVNEG